MGYCDYTFAWMRELTRQRRAERRAVVVAFPRPATIYARAVGLTPEFAGKRLQRNLRRRLRRSGILAALYRLQGYRCYLCPREIGRSATMEHVTPKRLGGEDENNVLLACDDCNNRKGSRPPHPCELLFCEAVYERLAGPSPVRRAA